MKDFKNFKFRASGIKNLMTTSRAKNDALSETTKMYLQEVWIEQTFGRKKFVVTPALQKGTIVESDSLALVEQVHGKAYFKNNEQLENDFITGTPDVIDKEEKKIIDVKSSWDLWTFASVNEKGATKDYYYQMLAYMWLTGSDKASLIYALVNTPDLIVNDEIYRMSFKVDETEAEGYRINYQFNDIDPKLRLKQYDFKFNPADVEMVKTKIKLCRDYLQGFSLEGFKNAPRVSVKDQAKEKEVARIIAYINKAQSVEQLRVCLEAVSGQDGKVKKLYEAKLRKLTNPHGITGRTA